MKLPKCEICKKAIKGKPSYAETKMLCGRCFYDKRMEARFERGEQSRNMSLINETKHLSS